MSKSKDQEGAQIDLLFDRPDHAITICEINSASLFAIDKNAQNPLKKCKSSKNIQSLKNI